MANRIFPFGHIKSCSNNYWLYIKTNALRNLVLWGSQCSTAQVLCNQSPAGHIRLHSSTKTELATSSCRCLPSNEVQRCLIRAVAEAGRPKGRFPASSQHSLAWTEMETQGAQRQTAAAITTDQEEQAASYYSQAFDLWTTQQQQQQLKHKSPLIFEGATVICPESLLQGSGQYSICPPRCWSWSGL